MFSNVTIASIIKTGKSNAIGALGENIVLNALRANGVKSYLTNKFYHGDIIANNRKIEVKTAVQNADKGFRFCLKKDDKYGRTDCHDSDFIVLQTIDKNLMVTYYLIPTHEIRVKHITLGQNSKKYAKYKTTIHNIVKAIS